MKIITSGGNFYISFTGTDLIDRQGSFVSGVDSVDGDYVRITAFRVVWGISESMSRCYIQ